VDIEIEFEVAGRTDQLIGKTEVEEGHRSGSALSRQEKMLSRG
jgi:hypothetical protein